MVNLDWEKAYGFGDLQQIVAQLRGPGGCPWDAKQTHESLKRCMMEETCEVLDAIEKKDMPLLCEELGDVLLQVVFHAALAEEAQAFTLRDVIDGVCRKMIRRHPHVFGTVDAASPDADWETLKREEKGNQTCAEELSAVARTLPALWRAQKLWKKSAAAGYCTLTAEQSMDAVSHTAKQLSQAADRRAALGEVLFAAAAAAYYSDIDPEQALHETADRYIEYISRKEHTIRGGGSCDTGWQNSE